MNTSTPKGPRYSMHEHLQDNTPEGVPMEEMIAFRRRVTSRDQFTGQDLSPWDTELIEACAAAFTAQDLQHGDLGPAFTDALSRHRGDVTAAHEEMMDAFGRTASPSYASRLTAAWKITAPRTTAPGRGNRLTAGPELLAPGLKK
jgi:hypothetical protein